MKFIFGQILLKIGSYCLKKIKLSRYLTGKVIATPVSGHQEVGPYEVAYNATNVPSGVYIYTLETSKGKETKRLVVIK